MTILQKIRNTVEGTPVERPDDEIVFVYGSLREGLGNHRYVEHCDRIGDLFTIEGFNMFPIGDQFSDQLTTQGISYPYCVTGDNSIVAECYLADEDTMASLDILEGYPKFYNRKKVRGKDEDGNTIVGWVYYIDNAWGRHLIPDGDWSAFLKSVEVAMAEKAYRKEITGEDEES